MNLKEAFRYQSFLTRRFDSLIFYMSDKEVIYDITVRHLRSKANPGLDDYEEKVPGSAVGTFEQIFNAAKVILDEKEYVSSAITKAKRTCPIDIDHAVSQNKSLRHLINTLETVCAKNEYKGDKAKKGTATDYVFNAEGNQTSCRYNTETDYVFAFDRQSVKEYLRAIQSRADAMSASMDKIYIETVVDFEPKFDVNSSLEDVVNAVETMTAK